MRVRLLVVASVLALAAVGTASAQSDAPEPAPSPSPELVLLANEQATPRLQVLHFQTPAVGGTTEVRVLLPDGYDPSGATRYPVLYLLHGATGDSSTWLRNVDVAGITAGVPLIVVMPSGGLFGYYADWFEAGPHGRPRWETYHLEQLLPWIDAHYPTVGTRDGRAVTGDSMGGLGAMHYAAKRPDLFTAAGSFSGAIDTNFFVAPPIVELSTMAEYSHHPAAVFGPRATEEIRWRGHNPFDLAENLRGLLLQFDVGNLGDPVEMAMNVMAHNVHDRLDDLGIEHGFDDYGLGCHCWEYYRRDLQSFVPQIMERFAHPAPPPSPFSYRSIDARWSMWGWDVAIDRSHVEFSRLFDAGPDGFGLTGSGDATVTTASLFESGQTLTPTIVDARGTTTPTLTADADGRLTVPVALGPANPFQQWSPQGNLWTILRLQRPGTWPSVTATVRFAQP